MLSRRGDSVAILQRKKPPFWTGVVLTLRSARVGKGGSNLRATAGEGAAQKMRKTLQVGSNLKENRNQTKST